MDKLAEFSVDYASAREKFRHAASALGWNVESHAIDATGPQGEELTIDVACSTMQPCDKTLVLSSGLHGVEGFFGSAVQIASLQRWASTGPPPTKCVMLHGLNPYGFAWLRRFNEDNVDPNRNFLLAGQPHQGAPSGYAELDQLLNPKCPPSRWEPFRLKALWAIIRKGLQPLKQTIAAGQYEFPRGLFFGGSGPSQTQRLLDQHMGRWLSGSGRVAHLDFHTGLGPMGAWKLLLDHPLTPTQRNDLEDWFGADSYEDFDAGNVAYDVRGGFGNWCVSQDFAPDYLFLCAEFGTYGLVPVITGLRSENQAHHWGQPHAETTLRAKHQLKEIFCPAAETWRRQVLGDGVTLVEDTVAGLTR